MRGEPLDPSTVLVVFTYNGDSDADGDVDADDYHRIDRGFLVQKSDPSVLTYRFGDFDYDNVIDLDDYALIDGAFLAQGGAAGSLAQSPAAVPEPSAVLLLAGLPSMIKRRRR